ncbi:hypothetical protein [Actinocatenispora rupis]|uniref:Uncharacterized protein n=1 Tax=Actinocatenispora rupis TaxID=519421 RepID=A0A8J3JBP4_9ACTN|nr:hypothetical protein [Actinocatenispora rupis]GID15475.1 hypothetical protein Aru02nite_63640 [Actinocatenispora rupis]
MRYRLGIVALVAAVSATAGCAQHASAGPPTMDQVGHTLAGDPVLHWTGSWHWEKATMTADLRTMGSGDGVGTVTVDGVTGRVLLHGGHLFVHASRDFWRKTGESSTDAAGLGTHWVDLGDPKHSATSLLFQGIWLDQLAPRRLGDALRGTDGDAPSCVAPGQYYTGDHTWKPARAATQPRGVPAGSLRYTTPPWASCAPGTYWVARQAPHQLLAYVGVAQPVGTNADDHDKDTTVTSDLAVRAGTAAQGRSAYAELARDLRALPVTVQVPSSADVDLSSYAVLPGLCVGADCAHLDVSVTGYNNSDRLTVRMAVGVSVAGDGKPGGECTATLGPLKPRTHARTTCSVTDPRVARISAGKSSVAWSESDNAYLLSATEPVDPAALAATAH